VVLSKVVAADTLFR